MPGRSKAIAAAAGLLALAGLAHANPLPLPLVDTDAEALFLSRTIARSLAHRQDASSSTNDSASSSPSASNVTTFDYTLTTSVLNNTNLNFQPQPYVSNGYIGARLPAAGVGCQTFVPTLNNDTFHNGTQGWPLFTPRQTASMVSGFYAQVPNDEVPGVSDCLRTKGKRLLTFFTRRPTMSSREDSKSSLSFPPGPHSTSPLHSP